MIIKEDWRVPDPAQGSSGYSAQADCHHAEMPNLLQEKSRDRNLCKIASYLSWYQYLILLLETDSVFKILYEPTSDKAIKHSYQNSSVTGHL